MKGSGIDVNKIKNGKDSKEIDLPDPAGDLSKDMPSSAITAANTMVKAMPTAVPRKEYVKLTSAQRYQIGKKAAEIGIAAALRFSKKNHH